MASGVNSLQLLARSAREYIGTNVAAIMTFSQHQPDRIAASLDLSTLRILKRISRVPAHDIRTGALGPDFAAKLVRFAKVGGVQVALLATIGHRSYSLVCYQRGSELTDSQVERFRVCCRFIRAAIEVALGGERAPAQRRIRIARPLNLRVSADERCRKEVADVLHGPIQTKLLLLDMRIHKLTEELQARGSASSLIADLASLEVDIDALREQDVRSLSHRLHPDLIGIGLGVALQALGNDVASLANVRVEFSEPLRSLDGVLDNQIPQSVRLEVYRMVEEAVNNAIRHGKARNITIRAEHATDILTITVVDDGRGFEQLREGFGIRTMKRRALRAGGTAVIEPLPGRGCRVSLGIPLRMAGDRGLTCV
jgi:two-component sensor histidine kinase